MKDFKKALKKESELRLDILGPWASDVVKEEASWRLDLYRGWLQMLADGVGEPVFEEGEVEYPWNTEMEPPRRRKRRRSTGEEKGGERRRKRRSTAPSSKPTRRKRENQ